MFDWLPSTDASVALVLPIPSAQATSSLGGSCEFPSSREVPLGNEVGVVYLRLVAVSHFAVVLPLGSTHLFITHSPLDV